MKHSINKFLVGFIIVLGFIVLFPTHKADAKTFVVWWTPLDQGAIEQVWTNPQILHDYGNTYVLVNLNKKIYDPGEQMNITSAITRRYGDKDQHVVTERILGPNQSYTGPVKVLIDITSRMGTIEFRWAKEKAPMDGGNFVMKIHYVTSYKSGNFGLDRTVQTRQFDMPFQVSGCNPPVGYEKCSNENQTCSFKKGDVDVQANVQYGCKPFFKLKEEVTNSIACNSETFGGDPVPDFYKACFYKAYPDLPTKCASPCKGSYNSTNPYDLPVSSTPPDSFSFLYCDGKATISMDKKDYFSGQQIRITSVAENFRESGCPLGIINVTDISKPSGTKSTMPVENGSVTFTAPTSPGVYNINIGIPTETEFGTTINDSNGFTMTYRVVDSVTKSCNVFSSQNECGAQSGCSWDTTCDPVVPITVKIWANGKNPELIKKNEKVRVTWDTTGPVAECKCTYPMDKDHPNEDCGSGTGINVLAKEKFYTLAETKTFTVTCSDTPTASYSAPARIPPTITKVYDTLAGVNPTYAIQGFKIGPSIKSGDEFSLMVYSHSVSVTATRIDTPQTIVKKLVTAINNTTLAEWNEWGTSYAHVYKPRAQVMQDQTVIGLSLNKGNRFVGSVVVAK